MQPSSHSDGSIEPHIGDELLARLEATATSPERAVRVRMLQRDSKGTLARVRGRAKCGSRVCFGFRGAPSPRPRRLALFNFGVDGTACKLGAWTLPTSGHLDLLRLEGKLGLGAHAPTADELRDGLVAALDHYLAIATPMAEEAELVDLLPSWRAREGNVQTALGVDRSPCPGVRIRPRTTLYADPSDARFADWGWGWSSIVIQL